jgi:hypothetical protein
MKLFWSNFFLLFGRKMVDDAYPVSQHLTCPFDFMKSGYGTFCSLYSTDPFWNGHLYFCMSKVRPVGKISFKSYTHHRDWAPNAYDSDRLAAASAVP